RNVPSLCGQRKCPVGYTGGNCQQLVVDKEPPVVEHCPGDLWVIAKNGSAVVTWDEPHFSDNIGVTKIYERNGHRSGTTLLWGTYDITYIASDAAGNTASCSFKVSLLTDFCPALADPVGGSQVCKDWGAGGQFKVCEIACNAGLRFSEQVPEFYTCGAEGFWRPTREPSMPLVYPSCSPSKPAQRVFRIKMLFPSDVLCNKAGQAVLRQKVTNSVNGLNRDWNFCSYAIEGTRECKDIQIDVKCDHYRGAQNNRVRRQAKDGGVYVMEAELPVVNDEDDDLALTGRQGRQQTGGDTYTLEIAFPAVKYAN
ncbi:GL19677, partial [Drosophila persimilis]